MSPRRKKRSAEVRNSLRLFGLLAVLAGVNVYVFFFNAKTAPREILKPSSTVRAAEGTAGTLRQAADNAKAEIEAKLDGKAGTKTAIQSPDAGVASKSASAKADAGKAAQARKAATASKLPHAVVPGGKAVGAAGSGAAGPKGQPGGSPGDDSEESPNPEKRIGPSDTLGQLLAREGFEADGPKVVSALSRLFDPKLIRGGQAYSVHLDDQGEPDSFEYHPNAATRFVVTRGVSGSWIATRVDQPIETKTVTAQAGSIRRCTNRCSPRARARRWPACWSTCWRGT